MNFKFPIDNYIGCRYTNYIGGRYNDRRSKREEFEILANQALTEAVYYILLSLTQQLHGYGIMQNVEQLSGGRVKLAAGTLYGAINTLVEKGWIKALAEDKDSRKKEYVITDQGKDVLGAELERLTELIENGNRILGGVDI
ncbi:MAG: PadR family transcriptional regulator [Clostridiales bacterium]|nr:PadR family transcriptional regulator [Clostridiales bacterium]